MTETLGDRVVQARSDKSISAAELARRLGVSSVTVYRWEKKGVIPEGKTLLRIAELLEIDARWLLYGDAQTDRDDDPLVRHPSLRAFIEAFGADYRPQTIEQLKAAAFANGKAPDTPEGWRWFADRLEEALPK